MYHDEYYHDILVDTIYETVEPDISLYHKWDCDVTYEAKFLRCYDVTHSDVDMMSDSSHREVRRGKV